jgi:type 1 glutamine amidotransferase
MKIALAFMVLLSLPSAATAKGGKKKVLFFTKSAGFEHGPIKVGPDGESHALRVLRELADKNGFEVTHTKDGGVFTAEGLAPFDAFMFYATGDLTQPGTDKNPPMSPEGKALFLDLVNKGKGFIATHAGSDTFHSPADRFTDDGDKADPYIKMLGGEFIRHGQQQAGRVVCVDPRFPGAAACKEGNLLEEWYSFKNLAPDLHVITALATWSMKNTGSDSVYRRPPYPTTWARMQGKGRVFYTALGHREDVWTNPMFQSLLVGGIRWATGLASAGVKPNAAAATPGYRELPPDDSAKAKHAAAP